MTLPQSETDTTPARRRGPRALAGIVAIAVVGVIAVVGAIGVIQGRIDLPLSGEELQAVAPDRAVPEEIAAPIPVSDPTGPNPQSCATLYSDRMWNTLNRRALNAPEAPLSHGSTDPTLIAVLSENPGLTCSFGTEPSTALATTVVRITASQQTAALARLGAMGADCAAYEQGQRCLLTGRSEVGSTGETHIFRDDVWIASTWVNSTPTGYSASIVDTLFPG